MSLRANPLDIREQYEKQCKRRFDPTFLLNL